MTELTTCARGCRIPGAHIPGRHPNGPAAAACPGCLHRPAHAGTTVCDDCINRMAGALHGLSERWPELRDGASRGLSRNPGASIHTSDVTDVGDQWRPAVTDLVTDLRDWIEYVARFAEPAGPIRRLHLTQLTPSVALAAIRRNLVPLLRLHPALDASLVDDVLKYRHRADTALASDWQRRVPLGRPCPAPVYIDTVDDTGHTIATEQVCGAPLVAVLTAADFGRDSTIQCRAYPRDHVFPQTEWGALEEQLEELQQ